MINEITNTFSVYAGQNNENNIILTQLGGEKKKRGIKYKIWREIIITLNIIFYINLYNILKYGSEIIISKNIDILTMKRLIILIFLNILFYILFNIDSFYNIFSKSIYKWINEDLELFSILLISWFSINILFLSNNILLLLLIIELFSYTIYFLIIIKSNKFTSHLSIIYLLNGSFSTIFLLFGFYFIYSFTNISSFSDLTLFTEIINNGMNSIENNEIINKNINIGCFFIFLSLFLKLGGFPYSQNIIRLYRELDIRILFKLLLIPLIIYLFLFYKLFYSISFLSFNNYYYFFFFLLAFLSIFFGSFAGLFKNHIASILTYSSILNFGFLFIAIIIDITSQFKTSNFIEFIFVYTITNILLFLILIFYPSFNKVFNNEEINLNLAEPKSKIPYKIISYFIILNIIFSFIGIPPYAGFYVKFNLILNVLSNLSNLSIIIIILLLLGTIFSSFFYLKFLFNFFFNELKQSMFSFFYYNPTLNSYLISLLSLFLINYSLIIYYLFPYFNSSI